MAASTEAIKSIERVDSGTIVRLTGDIDMHRSRGVHQSLLELCRERPPKLVLDLREVDYMDSSGVGTLVDVYRKVNAYKGLFALVGPNARISNLFQITKLDHFFRIFATSEEALGAK
jgi:anti-sigma B factor antagonist